MLSTAKIKSPATPPAQLRKLSLALACSLIAPSIAAQETHARAEEVIVTATLLPRSVDEIAGTVSVVGLEQIERQLIEDLNEVTRLQPGVTMDVAPEAATKALPFAASVAIAYSPLSTAFAVAISMPLAPPPMEKTLSRWTIFAR